MLYFVFLCRSGVAISTAMTAGPQFGSRILTAGKLALSGLTTGSNYPVCYGRIPVRDLPSFWSCRLCGGE
jgi:hypothetical protein